MVKQNLKPVVERAIEQNSGDWDSIMIPENDAEVVSNV